MVNGLTLRSKLFFKGVPYTHSYSIYVRIWGGEDLLQGCKVYPKIPPQSHFQVKIFTAY
jgi:hypothetical protein